MKYYTWLFLVLFSTILMAQNSGKGFNYQGVARTIDGQPRGSENIELRFSLIPEIGMNPAWVETHVTTTSPFGVFAVIVGKGIRETGLYSTYQEVSFENHDYWLKIELQEEGQWKELSQFQLPSMPYAEVAHTSKIGGIPPGSIIRLLGRKKIFQMDGCFVMVVNWTVPNTTFYIPPLAMPGETEMGQLLLICPT
jgi:hypothetical protein